MADGEYGEAELAERLLPIFRDPSFPDLSTQEALTRLKSAYDEGGVTWNANAKDYFASEAQKIWQSNQESPNMEWFQKIERPDVKGLSEDEQSEAWDSWRNLIVRNVAEDQGSNWLAIQNPATQFIDDYVRQQKRIAQGSDTSAITDPFRRIAAGAVEFGVGKLIGAPDTAHDIADWFETNPKYDNTFYGQVAEGLGQAPIQIGIPAAVGLLAAETLALPATAVAATVAMAIGGIASYRDSYDQTLSETGSEQMATEAGIKNGLANGSIEALSSVLIQKRFIEPFALGLKTENKARLIAGKLAEGSLIEGPTEFAQSLAQQAIQSPYTGKEIDYDQATREGMVGAAVGGILGAGGAAIGSRNKTEKEINQRRDDILDEAGSKKQLALPPGKGQLALPAPEGITYGEDFTMRDPVTERGFELRGEPYSTNFQIIEDEKKGKEPEDKTQKQIPFEERLLLPEISSLNADEQISLASQLQAFADGKPNFAKINGIKAANIPADLLNVLDLTATDTPGGVEIRKINHAPTYPVLEYEEEGDVTPELNTRALQGEFVALSARLAQLPTDTELQSKMDYNIKLLNESQIALQKIKNPTGAKALKDRMAALAKVIMSQRKEIRLEKRTGRLGRQRRAIRERMAEIQELIKTGEEEASTNESATTETEQGTDLVGREGITETTNVSPAEEVQGERSEPAPDERAGKENEALSNNEQVRAVVGAAPIEQFDPRGLRLSEDVAQYKEGADEKGVVAPLPGKFDWRTQSPIFVWRRKNGTDEVISGRHRLDLAQRTINEAEQAGEDTSRMKIEAKIFDESEGFTAQDARTLDVLQNIREGQGTPRDYLRYFQNFPMQEARARELGILQGRRNQSGETIEGPGKTGYSIATFGSPDLVTLALNKKIPFDTARAVAEAAPNNQALQKYGLDKLAGKEKPDVVVNMLKLAGKDPEYRALLEGNTGTEEQTDMFGSGRNKALMDRMAQEARAAAEIQRETRERFTTIRGAAKKPDVARREGIKIGDEAALKQRADDLRNELLRLESFQNDPEMLARVRERARMENEINEIPEARRSKSTNTIYSDSIAPDLRRMIAYWSSGFNVRDNTVLTIDEINNGVLDKLNPALAAEFKEAYDRKVQAGGPTLEQSGGFAFVSQKGNGSLIALGNGEFSPQTLQVAGHEIGHVIFRTSWQNSAPDVQQQVRTDFLNAIEDLYKPLDSNRVGTLRRPNANKPVSEWAAELLGPGSMFEGDTRTAAELTPDEFNYLFGDSVGFEEFFANRVSEFVTNPNKKPASLAQQLYKSIADQLRKLWNQVRAVFAPSQSLDDWLTDVFTHSGAQSFINSNFPRGTDTATEAGQGVRARAFSERVRMSRKVDKGVRAAVGEQLYNQRSPETARARILQDFDANDIEGEMDKALDFTNDLTYQERIVYADVIATELNRQIKAGRKNGDDVTDLIDQKADFAARIAEEGTELGRGVQAFTGFAYMGADGFKRRVQKDLTKILGTDPDGSPRKLPPGLEQKIDEIFEKIDAVKDVSGSRDDSTITAELARQAVEAAGNAIPGKPLDAISYYWYQNMLSGLSTQTVNVQGSGMNLTLRALSLALVDPKNFNALVSGLAKGVPRGLDTAKAIWAGRVPASSSKFEQAALRRSIPPVLRFENALANMMIGRPITFFNRGLKYVARAMNAADAFFYRTAKEGMAHYAAARILRRQGVESGDLAALISEELYNSTEEMNKALAQSRKEWNASGEKFNDRDVAIRAYQIIDRARAPEIENVAERFGRLATYTEQPQGTFGALAEGLNKAISMAPPLRIAFPFVNVVSNVLSQAFDFSPIGIARAAAGTNLMSKLRSEGAVQFSPEERLMRLGSGLLGTTLLAGAWAAADAGLDDENPWFSVYARGPQNKGQREALRAAGWIPYSMKFGDTYIKYSEMPIGPIMAWLGELHDAYRYSPSFNKKDPGDKFVQSLANVGRVALDMGFLRNIADLVEVVRGDKNPLSLPVNAIKPLIPFQGLVRDLAKTTDNYELDPKAFTSAFLKGLPWIQSYAGRPALNGFGEPIKTNEFFSGVPGVEQVATPILGRFASTKTEDPEWRFLANKNAYVPKMGTNTSIGITNPTGGQKKKIERNKEERERTMGRAAYDQLTYDEIYDLTKAAGPEIKKGVRELMRKGQNYSDQKVQDELDKIVDRARREAKIEMFGY